MEALKRGIWGLERENFQKYVSQNCWYIMVSSLLFLLLYGGWIFNMMPRVDSETAINSFAASGWLQIGRQGLVLTDLLLGIQWFNPFLSNGLGFLLFCISGVLLGYCCSRAGHVDGRFTACVALMIFCCPLMTEQFYFELQILEVAFAYCLCALAVGFSFYGIFLRSIFAKIAALICMVWAFSTYQIFAVIYIAETVFLFILFYQRWSLDEISQRTEKEYWGIAAWQAGLFLIAMAANHLITGLFNQSGYIENQINWKSGSFQECMRNIARHVLDAATGRGIFYTVFYIFFAALSVGLAVYCCWKRKKGSYIYLMAVTGLQFTPFLLTFYLGQAPVFRAQMVYPIVLVFDIIFCLHVLRPYRVGMAVIGLAAVVCLWNQTGMTMRLVYTDRIRAQEDARLACELETRIHQISEIRKPVAFIGGYQNQLNHACIRGDAIGTSVFSWDLYQEPHYWHCSNRSCNIMKILGIEFENVSAEQMLEARSIALNMPSWPAKGSTADAGEYVIVKFADDLWPEEVIHPAWEACSITVTAWEGLRCAVDQITVTDEKLLIQGWMNETNVSSLDVQPTVYLQDTESGQTYRLNTYRMKRSDLVAALDNGSLYEYSGYRAAAPIEKLNKPLEEYSLFVGLRALDGTEKILDGTQYWLEKLGA